MSDLAVMRLHDPTYAPAYRRGLADLAQFRVEDFGDDVVGVAPLEGAGAVVPYLRAERLGDANTNWTLEETWRPVLTRPPRERQGWTQDDTSRLLRRADELKLREGDQAADLAALGLAIIAFSNGGQLVESLGPGVPTLFDSFPEGSLWWVSVDDLLLARATVLRSQFARTLTPDLRPSASLDDFERLAALEGLSLTSGIDFSAIYLPPLLAFSPGAAGIVFSAAPHALVLLYGGLQDLRQPWPHAVASLYEPRVLNDPRDLADPDLLDTFSPPDAEALLTWWVGRMNVLHSHGLDPTRFTDTVTAQHDAASQTAFLLTVERLLTDGIHLLGQPQAPSMQRLHTAFDLLDKAETLLGYDDSGKGFMALLRRRKAEPRLHEALAGIPIVGQRFWERTSRLYDALFRSILDRSLGFRRTPKGGVRVASKEAHLLEAMSADDYVAALVRAVRNSAHGLLQSLTQSDQRFLLATNQCDIPGELADLAAMVMFALVADAEALCDGTWAQGLRI